jgi:hypothetical protein
MSPHQHEILPASKALLAAIAILVLLAGIQLCIYGRETHIYFAWTISSPLVAALIGSGYWAALVALLVAWRDLTWHHIAGAAPSTFTPTLLLFLATLLHWDRFHFSSPVLITWLAAWIWLAVYVLAPVLATWAAVVERRRAGRPKPLGASLALSIEVGFAVVAIIAAAVGAALWLAPQAVAPIWPTPLTPLLARALGSVILSIAAGSAMVALAGDYYRARVAIHGLGAVAALQLVSIWRFAGDMAWSRPSAMIYVGVLVCLAVLAIVAILHGEGRLRRARSVNS